MNTMSKGSLALFSMLALAGCAGRQVISENNLPEKVMDSRVELNAELFGTPYTDATRVNLYVDAQTAKEMHGMVFHYLFDPELQLVIDGHETQFQGKPRADHLEVDNVPKALITQIANAQVVEVRASADHKRIAYKSSFSRKNKMKFQEFVHDYIDKNQTVERPSFLERVLSGGSDD